MITVSNGIDTFSITKGAFPVYKTMGFRVVDEHEADEHEADEHTAEVPVDDDSLNIVDESDISDEDAAFLNAIVEKPISQWSSIEVKKYANLNGIDISRAKNLKEGKAIVKRHFDEVAKSNM